MTKVSKYIVAKEVKERMFDVFWQTIADLKNPSSVQGFFQELLTPTEQLMLAKRLAIAILILKKYSYTEIIDILKVSPVTIGSIARWLNTEGQAFQVAIDKILKKERQEDFWDNLEQFLSEIIPPGRGVNWERARSQQFTKIRSRRQRRSIL